MTALVLNAVNVPPATRSIKQIITDNAMECQWQCTTRYRCGTVLTGSWELGANLVAFQCTIWSVCGSCGCFATEDVSPGRFARSPGSNLESLHRYFQWMHDGLFVLGTAPEAIRVRLVMVKETLVIRAETRRPLCPVSSTMLSSRPRIKDSVCPAVPLFLGV